MFSLFRSRRTNRKFRARRVPAASRPRLGLDPIEDRLCPSGGSLVVGSFNNNGILRYDESTGAFIDQFDLHNLGNLKSPTGGVFGPDGNLYVTSGVFLKNNHKVLQYNGTTGEFLRVFASQNLTSPRGVLFGPDGNLYVGNGNSEADDDPASVERFDGKTGAFLDYFVAPSSGGLEHPSYLVFGPNGKTDGKLDLYVASAHEGSILRYDGTTGTFKGVFVSAASGGLDSPQGMLFGTDGNLYVASGNWFAGSNGPFYSGEFPPGAVLRYEGPTGANPGAFLGTFISGGSGGLANPAGMVFGPDASGDGKADLYIANCVQSGSGDLIAETGTSNVLRYDAVTGNSLGAFVTPKSGLRFPSFLTFTETDPTTLNYIGVARRSAAVSLINTVDANQSAGQPQPGSAENLHRQPDADFDTLALQGIDIRVTILGSTTQGLGSGNPGQPGGNPVRRLGDDLLRCVWLLEKTPGNDFEFGRPDSLE